MSGDDRESRLQRWAERWEWRFKRLEQRMDPYYGFFEAAYGCWMIFAALFLFVLITLFMVMAFISLLQEMA